MVDPSIHVDPAAQKGRPRTAPDANGPSPATRPDQPALKRSERTTLERDLGKVEGRRWLRWLVIVVGIVAVGFGASRWYATTRPPPPPKYVTAEVSRGDIFETVQSTGQVKPLTEVQVGAQVSGRMVKVHVDFNSKVKKGDLLAEIDPTLYGAQVSQSGAQLKAAEASAKRAQARLTTAKAGLKRLQGLKAEGIATPADVEQAQGEHDVAEADLAASSAQISQIRAQLSGARTTLAYARIFSPIDGIVVNRAVDPGQTVAASFAAPVLFVIAQDLSKMQVLAEIDEADVGKIREQMKADVVVDAFVGQKFQGTVTQVRFSPNNVQGVVTYSAVIEVGNPELKLRPGMTATVTIKTREAKGALAMRNAALRFRPLPDKDEDGKPKPVKPPPPLDPGKGRVYLMTGGARGAETVEDRVVGVGITDGIWTELTDPAGLVTGQAVVVEQRDEKKQKRFGMF
ncbi:MAG: efflux RND transporter periplasmic adaptor subunit [Polyangiaceae bacterium]|nr:efflux RND transporter periplasmic adaptor subunit [Polyangiaceae bacterium]